MNGRRLLCVVAVVALVVVACSDNETRIPTEQTIGFLEFTNVEILHDDQQQAGVLFEFRLKVWRIRNAGLEIPPDGTAVSIRTNIGFFDDGAQETEVFTENGLTGFRLHVQGESTGSVTAEYAGSSAAVALRVGPDGSQTVS